MRKIRKQWMTLFMVLAFTFSVIAPITAWAEEPANVDEPSVEASKAEASIEEPAQTESEESLTETETEGKVSEEKESLEFSEENTPTAQYESAAEKLFTVTKRPVSDPSAQETPVGDYPTFYDAIDACKAAGTNHAYTITMNGDYTIPDMKQFRTIVNLDILLRSAKNKHYTMKKMKMTPLINLEGKSTLTIQDITLDGAKVGSLAAVRNVSKLILGRGAVIQNFIYAVPDVAPVISLSGNATLEVQEGAIFQNNTYKFNGHSIIPGVIYADHGTQVNIRGGKFKNNSSTEAGGLLTATSRSEINISGGTFENNHSDKDGGVISTSGKLTITGGRFQNNSATGGGGAICTSGEMAISKATFIGNKANSSGAIFFTKTDSSVPGKIDKSAFTSNESKSNSGAIGVLDDLTISNSSFNGNKSGIGGAITAYQNLKLIKTTFENNKATKHGGAIYVFGYASNWYQSWAFRYDMKVDISEYTQFISNTADEEGGAIYAQRSQYKDPIVFSNADLPKEAGTTPYMPYQNLKIDGDTVFQGNKASQSYLPPSNWADFKDLNFERNSFTGKTDVDGRFQKSLLNNDDVNYKNVRKITYDANGGTFGDESKTKTEEYPAGAVIRLIGAPEREGYEFLHWKDDEGTYEVGGSYKVSEDHIFTAEWKEMRATIIVDPNGGVFSDGKTEKLSSDVRVGETFMLPEAPMREGYKFVAWQGKDGTDYQPTSEYIVPKDGETFTAQWEKKQTSDMPQLARITFKANGGTWANGDTIRTYYKAAGSQITIEPAPMREGYRFLYWEGSSYQPGEIFTVPADGHTFTARWEEEKKPEEKPSVTPNIKTPKGTPLTPDEIAKILAGMKKTVPAIPRAGVGK